MKKRNIKFLAFFMTLCLFLSSCADKKPQVTTEQTTVTTTTASSATEEAVITTLAALASEDETIAKEEPKPLTVALSEYGTVCSPFYQNGDCNSFLNELTGVKLLASDRNGRIVYNGIKGEMRVYNGRYYTYTGISDVTETYNEEADETVYDIALRNDVKFSDGEILDADDLIFTLYVLLDPSFANISDIQGIDIKGEVNYRLNSTIADSVTAEEISEALAADEVKQIIRDTIVMPVLKSEYEWVKSLYDDNTYSVYTEAYPNPKDLMAFFYSVDSEYKSTDVPDEQTVLSDLADMYGGNYELLGSMSEGDSTYYRTDAVICAIGYLSEQAEANEPVNSISGIEKTGKFSVRITVSGNNPSVIYELGGITVAPLHYYGDESKFNISASSFGFEKGKALELVKAKENAPLGAGAYCYDKSESGVIYLSANENYYKGAPKTANIEVKMAAAENAVSAVADGVADISYPDGSVKTSDEIDSANEALEKLYASTISKDGYGYIGLNTRTVNVGGDSNSEESVALRKALATAIYLYRDASVENYYGDVGIRTDYPAALRAWLGDEYKKPYSVNAEGEDIYTESMTENERFNAAKAACLSFFEAAGYTVEGNVVTAAPEGGAMSFQAIIAADGKGNHPCYYALDAASKLLSEIGITLTITDTADASQMWAVIDSGSHQIWAAVWETGVQPRLSTMYAEDNLYGISDDVLDDSIVISASSKDNEELKTAYGNCLDILFNEYAVEIPVYQRSDCVLFSTLRVNTDTLPENMTGYYSWVNEAERIEKK
ncbi:MAG: ABC transporter substrate-binding protein [Ruminiclostridium sp.]|nr:ABC transporter substrate-binding protein [Ruminiclostridium sp.]